MAPDPSLVVKGSQEVPAGSGRWEPWVLVPHPFTWTGSHPWRVRQDGLHPGGTWGTRVWQWDIEPAHLGRNREEAPKFQTRTTSSLLPCAICIFVLNSKFKRLAHPKHVLFCFYIASGFFFPQSRNSSVGQMGICSLCHVTRWLWSMSSDLSILCNWPPLLVLRGPWACKGWTRHRSPLVPLRLLCSTQGPYLGVPLRPGVVNFTSLLPEQQCQPQSSALETWRGSS